MLRKLDNLSVAGLILAVCAFGLAFVRLAPGSAILSGAGGGSWIKFPEPFDLGRRPLRIESASFRARCDLASPLSFVTIELRAMKAARVLVDGRVVQAFGDMNAWKEPRAVTLPALSAGEHELQVDVADDHGPALLKLSAPALGLSTGLGWEASRDGGPWVAARDATAPQEADISRRFPTAAQSFLKTLPVTGPIFLLILVFSWLGLPAPKPGTFRWILLGAWAALALNDLFKFPLHAGFDAFDHMRYIWFLLENGRLPLGSDGWQMFQPPLFYLLCAPIYAVASKLGGPAAPLYMVRVIPLICGALQIELAYRLLRRAFPSRADLQRLGTMFAAFLPMNIYISQAPSNEPLAGALIAAVIVAAAALAERAKRRELAALGAALGFALLAKVSALLAIPAVIWFLWPRHGKRGAALVLGAAALVSGWFFLRNGIALGGPLLTLGTVRGFIDWRQDPGYRTWSQLWFWGGALTRPIYSATLGLWDAFYSTLWLDGYLSGVVVFDARPPWDYDLLCAGAWLALLPTAGILLGIFRGLVGKDALKRDALGLSVVCLGVFLAAFVGLFLLNPVYTTAKATYTLGLMPCYAVLLCAGLERMCAGRISRALVYAGMTCWGLASYCAYFIR